MRPYFFAGFQGVTLAGQKDAPNVRPYIFGWFSVVYVGESKGRAERAFVHFFALRFGNFAVVWRKNRIFAGLKD